MKIAVINGPNLNFLGIREPGVYGMNTLSELENGLVAYGKEKNIVIRCFQSNSEGELIDYLQQCYHEKVDGIICNPGAYTHYSYAISDAIKSISLPVLEVHISNIHAREEFRQHSVTAKNCVGLIGGFGFYGYYMAIDAMLHLKKQ